jgi:predicted nucleotidyltransferase
MTTPEVIQLITERIVRDFHPLRLILFGSHARGDARPESDVDLLAVLPQVANKRAAAIAIRRALVDLPVCKDIVVTTRKKSPAAVIFLVPYYGQRFGRERCFMNEVEHLVATRRWPGPVHGRRASREAA